ncbi:MAG: GNAT family N-acetyltransferase [Bacteroidetes bacterium]|nr:GNAT family N-acetyltransferase [Bacteroidota bacterium]
MNNITIRKAGKADMPAVHHLVQELAEFEKAPHEVITSPEIYQKDGFGDHPLFECFVAEIEEEGIVGITFFYIAYSTWKGKMLYLDDLVISSKHRRKGIGQQLLDHLVEYGKKQGVNHIRWHVLDWNQPAIEMYKKMGASLDTEWITCKLEFGN